MTTPLIVIRPRPWRRYARTSGRLSVATGVLLAHLVIAAIVLATRITYVIVKLAAVHAAYLELYLSKRTGKPALGQSAGRALAAAFTDEFHRARTGATAH